MEGVLSKGVCPRGFCPRGFCPEGVLSAHRVYTVFACTAACVRRIFALIICHCFVVLPCQLVHTIIHSKRNHRKITVLPRKVTGNKVTKIQRFGLAYMSTIKSFESLTIV